MEGTCGWRRTYERGGEGTDRRGAREEEQVNSSPLACFLGKQKESSPVGQESNKQKSSSEDWEIQKDEQRMERVWMVASGMEPKRDGREAGDCERVTFDTHEA